MKTPIVSYLAAALVAACAYAAPTDDLKTAAKKLADTPNYSWTTNTDSAGGGPNFGPTQGVTEKDGYTVVTRNFGGNPSLSVRKGEAVVLQNREGAWVTRDEMMQQFGGGSNGGGARPNRGGFFSVETPSHQLTALVDQIQNATLADGTLSADLTEQGATDALTMGPNPAKGATGSLKVWLKDGAVAKYQLHLKGTVTGRGGQERAVDQKTTIEIKDVGTTKVQVPEEAKKKLGS